MSSATQLTEEQLKAELAAKSAPVEVKLELPTGEVFKGATWEEVARKAAEAQQATKTAYQTEKQQREALSAEVEKLTPRPVPQTGETDYTEYWALVNSGKQIEAANWLDAKRFGLDSPQEVVPTITGAVQKTNQLYDRVEIETFKMNSPDFPPTAEAADALMAKVKQWGVPWDNGTLAGAWESVKKEGKIKPIEVKEAEKQPFAGPPPGATTVGTGSPMVGDTSAEMFAKLSLEEQGDFLRKHGLMR